MANKPKLALEFQDVPGLNETFADSIGHWHFDGSTLRIDFLVTRFQDTKSPEQRRGRRLPVCRLVLTAPGTLQLLNEARRIGAALEQAGLIKSGNALPSPKGAN